MHAIHSGTTHIEIRIYYTQTVAYCVYYAWTECATNECKQWLYDYLLNVGILDTDTSGARSWALLNLQIWWVWSFSGRWHSVIRIHSQYFFSIEHFLFIFAQMHFGWMFQIGTLMDFEKQFLFFSHQKFFWNGIWFVNDTILLPHFWNDTILLRADSLTFFILIKSFNMWQNWSYSVEYSGLKNYQKWVKLRTLFSIMVRIGAKIDICLRFFDFSRFYWIAQKKLAKYICSLNFNDKLLRTKKIVLWRVLLITTFFVEKTSFV